MTACGPQTVFWLATPTGTAAIAVTVVDGPGAGDLVSKFFRSMQGNSAVRIPPGGFRYGRWRSDQDPLPQTSDNPASQTKPAGEDLIVCRTAANQFEIHSHGGRIATTRIASDLLGQGARQTTWQDWLVATRPWFQSRPHIAWLHASTSRTASLLDQQRLNWTRFADKVRTQSGNMATLTEELQCMLAAENFGLHLVRPRKLALFGPANAGKSSLMNRLAGFGRSIIHDRPGTTRDVVSLSTVIDGWPVEVLDTAGLRTEVDEIERQGIEFARLAVASAAIRLLVLDSANDRDVAEYDALLALQPDLVIWNKLDLAAGSRNLPPGSVGISALTGQGLPELIARIGEMLGTGQPDRDLPAPLDEVMCEKLKQAISLAATNDRAAIRQLFSDDTDPVSGDLPAG